MYAVVMIKGTAKMNMDAKTTLKNLRLTRANHCVVLDENPTYKGMLHKAREFITWGELDNDVLEQIVLKRGRLPGDKRIDGKVAKEIVHRVEKEKTFKNVSIKPVFRLTPPSKGMKSTKKHFPKGELGYRGRAINKLIKRMI